jgi:hypothetical protein
MAGTALLEPAVSVEEAEPVLASDPVVAGGYVAVFPPVASAPDAVPPPSTPVAAAIDPRGRPVETSTPMALLVAAEPLETPYDASGWLVRGGSLAATISFLLPWGASSVGVVGTGAIGYGYFDRWALVNAWYLLPMLLALFVFGLSVVPNRLLPWIRSGVLPLVTGALCLGIAFVYIGGPFGGGPGLAILAAASLALVGGGLLAIRPDRHGEPPAIV